MSTCTYARWTPPVPTELPKLAGCFADFWDAKEFAGRLEKAMKSKPADYILMDALSSALVVRYSRSFKEGKRARLKLSDDLRLTEEERILHQRVLDIRDKHTAHPVNRFETQDVYVGIVRDAREQACVTVVSSGTRTQISLTLNEVRTVTSLCRKWLGWLHDEEMAEGQRLLSLAQSLSPDELSRLPVGPVEPDPSPRKERVRLGQ